MNVEAHAPQAVRLDKLSPAPRRADPLNGPTPEPAQCPDCSAVYYEGRWRWGAVPLAAYEVRCPACRRLHDNKPAASLTLGGASVALHRAEMKRVVQEREAAQRRVNPLQRIMRIDDTARGLRVLTTDMHLARDIGEALREIYGGALDFEYDSQDGLRVRWER